MSHGSDLVVKVLPM